MNQLFTLLLTFLIANSLSSQVPQEIKIVNDKKCATPELHEEKMRTDKKYRREMNRFERKLRSENKKSKRTKKRTK
ncbi:MAG: hypothetical protein RL264_725 [Bacteroidota bacterium]|jgi:hypothetical protein